MTSPASPPQPSVSPERLSDSFTSAHPKPLVNPMSTSSSSPLAPLTMPPVYPGGLSSWFSPGELLDNTDTFDWSLFLPVMSRDGSNSSPSTDFAFQPPAMTSDNVTPPYSNSTGMSASTGYPSSLASHGTYGFPSQGYPWFGTGSSFSSTSGSATGNSFSSVHALPAISRDFVRPSTTETKRPATAGGAMQSRGPFLGYMPSPSQGDQRARDVDKTESPIGEGVGFLSNPFALSSLGRVGHNKQSQQDQSSVDPHFVSFGRESIPHGTASDHQSGMWSGLLPTSNWTNPSATNAFTLYGDNHNQQSQLQNFARSNTANLDGRPQTSDGLPSYANFGTQAPLPSARSIAKSAESGSGRTGYHADFMSQAALVDQHRLPSHDPRVSSMIDQPRISQTRFPLDSAGSTSITGIRKVSPQGPIRASYITPLTANETVEPAPLSAELTFVPLSGPALKKRARRRHEEIDRIYKCGFNYIENGVEGTCAKGYGTLNHLNSHISMQKHGSKRHQSEFSDMRKAWLKEKKNKAAGLRSLQSSVPPHSNQNARSQRKSVVSTSSDSRFDRRDSTMSMVSAGSDLSHPGAHHYAQSYGWSHDSRPTTSSSVASVDSRSSAPALPATCSHSFIHSLRTVTRRPSAPQHVFLPPGGVPYGFPESEGDYLTPTQQNPFPGRQGNFPFQTLTSTTLMSTGPSQPYDNQFAFQC